MSLFDFLKPKKQNLTPEEQEDKMWDLWTKGKAASPYAQLMTYESEINNGGHSQFFLNVANVGDLRKTAQVLLDALPGVLKENFQKAYDAYLQDEDEDNEETTEIFDACDDVFYANEALLIAVLKEYAASL